MGVRGCRGGAARAGCGLCWGACGCLAGAGRAAEDDAEGLAAGGAGTSIGPPH